MALFKDFLTGSEHYPIERRVFERLASETYNGWRVEPGITREQYIATHNLHLWCFREANYSTIQQGERNKGFSNSGSFQEDAIFMTPCKELPSIERELQSTVVLSR